MINNLIRITMLTSILTFALLIGDQAYGQTDLGLVGVKSTHGCYLQAHNGGDPDGEMHASKEERNEEETWHLVEVDGTKHIYGLLNWDNHKFLSKKDGECVFADRTTLSQSEQWVLVSGKSYGVVNAVAFKSVKDGTFMGANSPKDNTKCGGEVAASDGGSPPNNHGEWAGWWVLEPAKTPEKGKDFWTTIKSGIDGIVAQLKPADVAALISLISS